MRGIVEELGLSSQWTFIPMLESNPEQTNLQSVDLGPKLTQALMEARRRSASSDEKQQQRGHGPVIFVGMDAPELPLDEIGAALAHPHDALLCPAMDGGYGLLSVPAGVDAQKVFLPLSAGNHSNIRWSTCLTALAQIKALTDVDIRVRLGRLMHDMDEPKDLEGLCQRLQSAAAATTVSPSSSPSNVERGLQRQPVDCLLRSSSGGLALTSQCNHTRLELERQGLLQ